MLVLRNEDLSARPPLSIKVLGKISHRVVVNFRGCCWEFSNVDDFTNCQLLLYAWLLLGSASLIVFFLLMLLLLLLLLDGLYGLIRGNLLVRQRSIARVRLDVHRCIRFAQEVTIEAPSLKKTATLSLDRPRILSQLRGEIYGLERSVDQRFTVICDHVLVRIGSQEVRQVLLAVILMLVINSPIRLARLPLDFEVRDAQVRLTVAIDHERQARSMRVLNIAGDCLCLDARALLNHFVVAQLDLPFDFHSWHFVVQVLLVLVRIE